VITTKRPDLAHNLLNEVWARHGEGYVSAGTAVAHIKELTLCLRKAWYEHHLEELGLPPAPEFGEEFTDATRLKIILGTAFGRYVNEDEERVTIDSTEGELSGRVDLMMWEPDAEAVALSEQGWLPVPAELKVTWSFNDSLQPQYKEQVAGYCIAKGVRKARIFVVRVSAKGGPSLACVEEEFTDEELAGWKAELERRTRQARGPTVPSYTEHWTWECKECRFNMKNGGGCEALDGKKGEGWFSEYGRDE